MLDSLKTYSITPNHPDTLAHNTEPSKMPVSLITCFSLALGLSEHPDTID